MSLEALDGLVTEEFQAVAALNQRDSLRNDALEFDGSNFGAVLLTLALLLRLFVVVQLATDAVDGSVKQVDGRPKQVVKVRLEPRIAQRRDQGIKDVSDGTADDPAFGKRPWIGLIVEGAVTEELQFGKNVFGRRCGVRRFDVIVVGHGGDPLPDRPRPSRPSWRSLRRQAERARTRSRAEGRSAAEDG
nr:hypothetical protein [Bradyrhizobium sp. Ghvi]